ncbi:MAG: hypothetical protein ABI233_06945 [Chthoniobacterales bacterium]
MCIELFERVAERFLLLGFERRGQLDLGDHILSAPEIVLRVLSRHTIEASSGRAGDA